MDTRSRLAAYAAHHGSRAQTVRGQMASVRRYGIPHIPAKRCTYDRQAQLDDHAHGRALAAAIAAGAEQDAVLGALLLAGLTLAQARQFRPRAGAWIRQRLHLQGRHPLYIGGDNKIRTGGHGYSFRWLGRWKTAPGSYIASSRHGMVGIEYLRWLIGSGLTQYRGEGGGLYLRGRPAYDRHGVAVYPAASRTGARWLVLTRADIYYYHSTASDAVTAARHAMAAFRRRRQARIETARLAEIAPHVWVSRADSVAAGHCLYGTELAANRIERALYAEGPMGAVRGDVLLSLRGGDDFALRAIMAAEKRQSTRH